MLLRVVGGAIRREGRLLVAQRGPDRALAGCWELPGGKVELGETDAQALARELLEELQVRVQVGPLLGIGLWEGGARPIALLAYGCTLVAGEPRAVEHSAVAWCRPQDLDALRWAPADVPLLSSVRAWLTQA